MQGILKASKIVLVVSIVYTILMIVMHPALAEQMNNADEYVPNSLEDKDEKKDMSEKEKSFDTQSISTNDLSLIIVPITIIILVLLSVMVGVKRPRLKAKQNSSTSQNTSQIDQYGSLEAQYQSLYGTSPPQDYSAKNIQQGSQNDQYELERILQEYPQWFLK
jgi:hypothetical protein